MHSVTHSIKPLNSIFDFSVVLYQCIVMGVFVALNKSRAHLYRKHFTICRFSEPEFTPSHEVT
jgi:hypothetical protein